MLVAPTLGDTAKRFATVSTTCDHAGTFSRQTSSWPDIVMPELRHHLAQCPRRGPPWGTLAASAMSCGPDGEHVDPRRPSEGDHLTARTLAQAQAGGYTHLRATCPGCCRPADIALQQFRRPPETVIGSLKLRCSRCGPGVPAPTIGVVLAARGTGILDEKVNDASGHLLRRPALRAR